MSQRVSPAQLDEESADRRLSRRQMLESTGGAIAGLAGGQILATSAASAQAAEPAKSGSIDAHVHVWTPDTHRYPLSAGYRRDEMQPPSFTPEELLSHATPCGVDRIVLIQMSFYGFDNSYMLDTIERFPGTFAGVAVIDDEGSHPDVEMRKLLSHGVRGFRIYPRNHAIDTWLDGPGMQAMWKCGAETGQAMCHLVNPDALPAIDRTCEKHPETPVVIDHFARIGVDGTVRETDLDLLCQLARHRRAMVKLSAFYALGKKQVPYLDLVPMIRRLLDAYGVERLMWATDCPYQIAPGHEYADSIALIRDRLDFLSEGDREWLLKKTAERTFFAT